MRGRNPSPGALRRPLPPNSGLPELGIKGRSKSDKSDFDGRGGTPPVGRHSMPTERFQFEGEGGHQLAAALDLPDREPIAYALFAHCFTCGKDVLAARRIALALTAKGIAVLRFDFTGLGSSEGDFANSTF